jgi:hypothetical protein
MGFRWLGSARMVVFSQDKIEPADHLICRTDSKAETKCQHRLVPSKENKSSPETTRLNRVTNLTDN